MQSPPPPYTEKTILLSVPVATIVAVAVTLFLVLIITLIRKCINQRSIPNQSASCSAQSSNQNPKTAEPLGGVISLITYNTTPSDQSRSSSEMFGHTSCSVCLGDYENGDKVAVLRSCKHVFHEVCIRQWLPKRSVFCPVCRDPVMELKAASGSSHQGNHRLPSSAFVFGFGIRMHHQRQIV